MVWYTLWATSSQTHPVALVGNDESVTIQVFSFFLSFFAIHLPLTLTQFRERRKKGDYSV
jgi:hypothetical protein